MTEPNADSRKLSPRAIELLYESNDVRIEHINKPVFIPYARATGLLDEMESLICHPQTNRMPNMLIVARSNNGKTELLKEFLRRHPAEERPDEEAIYAPVIYIEFPPGPKDDMFLDCALKTVGLNSRGSDSPGDKIDSLANQLVKIKTKILLLDELNSILAGSVTKQLLLLTTIKYISNQTKISIVATGTADALNAVATDEQLTSRFPARLMPRWKDATPDFRQLLASFEFIFPLRAESKLSALQKARLIYGLSEGVLGEVARLLRASAIMAIKSGEESITEDILKSCASKRKPTQDDINAL
jgi:hypothetical protein